MKLSSHRQFLRDLPPRSIPAMWLCYKVRHILSIERQLIIHEERLVSRPESSEAHHTSPAAHAPRKIAQPGCSLPVQRYTHRQRPDDQARPNACDVPLETHTLVASELQLTTTYINIRRARRRVSSGKTVARGVSEIADGRGRAGLHCTCALEDSRWLQRRLTTAGI